MKQVILGFIKCLYLMVTSGIQWVELAMVLFSSYTKHATPPSLVTSMFLCSS